MTSIHPPTKVSQDSPFKPAGATTIGQCTSVKWGWNKALGVQDGYMLTIGKETLHFSAEECMDLVFWLPKPLTCEADHTDVSWMVAYRDGKIIEIKERQPMTDQPIEKTAGADELNKALGHWGASKEDYRAFIAEARKALVAMGVQNLQGAAIPAAQIARWADSPSDKLTDSPHANKTLAMEAVLAKGRAFVAEKTVPEHEHIFETAHCKVCGIHWEKVDKIRTALHAWIDELFKDRNADEKTHDEQYQYVKEANGVQHLAESDLNVEAFKAEAKGMVDTEYPLSNSSDQLSKELWIKWLPEFKTINTVVTDKTEAMKLILGLFGDVKTLAEVVGKIGADGAQKIWDESKLTLKPAAPKSSNGTHPTEPVQRKPAINLFADGDPFIDATDDTPYLRMALVGPAGSGKTYTALKVATSLIPGGKIALLDSERGSAAKYRNDFRFKVLKLEQYDPDYYIGAIHAAERNGYDVLIIDSLSHAWEGKGGILEMHDNEVKRMKTPNSFTAWREVTPMHNDLVDAMLNAKLHVIVTLRAKTEYVIEGNKVNKVGLAPIQRPGLDYEFDIVADLDQSNTFVVSKSRCSALNKLVINQAGKDVADKIRTWLSLDVGAA